MSIDKTRISGTQFMFTIVCFIQASSLLTSIVSSVLKQDSWVSVLLGVLAFLPILWLFYALMTRFPQKNLIQILEEVYGPIAGKIIGFFYAWYFLTSTSLNLTDMGYFTKLSLMADTPMIVLLLMFILVSAWAVRSGLTVVARYSVLFTVIAFTILAVSVLAVLNQMELSNLIPVFDMPLHRYIQGIHIMSTIPFGELIVILMIRPNVDISNRELKKYLFGGFFLGAFTILVVLLRDIVVLGNTLPIFSIPGLITLRLVDLGMAFNRIEILFALVFIILFFFKVTLLYYASVLVVAQLFKIRIYRRIVLAAGALMIAYGPTLYPDPIIHTVSAQTLEPFIWSMFETVIPLITLILTTIKKIPTKGSV